MKLFGFEFQRKVPVDTTPSFAPKEADDGAVIVAAGGAYGTYIDLDGTVRTEAELVTKYREMSLQPEIDSAVDEIVNESISIDEENIVSIILDNLEVTDKVKKVIRDEFQNVLNILDFQSRAYEIYRRWYIDGRLYYHVVIDEKNVSDGIKEVRYVDPRKIRKVREIGKRKVPGGDGHEAVVPKVQNEYFIFNDKGFNYGNKVVGPSTTGMKIAKDSVVYITSGLSDTQGTMVLSYLHKAIKALNQLRTLEDALVIYRLARAPERRIWYIDVGNLPKMKAEQYVRDIMVKHKNRLIYDGATGEVRDDRKFMTMLEDYWLPRREGGRGTEVTTLPGGQTLGQMDDVLYFQKKMYQTLNVPVNRLNSDALFSLGRATEVTRDELKFSKFISRLRGRFSTLFTSLLEKQLVLKGIMSIEDGQNIAPDIRFDFAKDNYFTELKNAEMIQNRA
ncbi:MAG: portal protein, partial [Bacteroidota bacterium]